ncbi:ComEC/Rec2 family competence protein [Beijerinckia indica]|uniref:ComEC/Rec2-related protein n=1 Tax=Beijerinckia indica subsp. indica (strain ATCC 9039 / DSM 1715 / NCIMB 8712) TaxID=395963 RepID=B2IKL2_BEII9|nr:ComEC/Rec2 family competence protein [Beijerinckia indica]ACB95051.1 ComEC/Rec2-related protein [Beijerinckia indica subsp. indica ATCC 9039]
MTPAALADKSEDSHSGRASASFGWFARMQRAFRLAFEVEVAERRLFPWLPVAAGAGVVLYFYADHEPPLWLNGALVAIFAILAWFGRQRRPALVILLGLCALFAGELSAGLRSMRVAAPVLDRITIATVEGTIEQMDYRPRGARFILRVGAIDGLNPEQTPYRVRLSTRRAPPFGAGTYVSLKARLLPPARASLPGGYDFARDAWFARIGAVGTALGRIETVSAPDPPGFGLAVMTALDRGRNALALRINSIVGGDAGAIAAAMVTGKRDLLSEQAKDVIREAGIFHIITISGVQMTLVVGIFFVGLRQILALSPRLALTYPIKKWAAAAAILAATLYDIVTGSRVGTERALVMTLIMLGAVLLDRQALTMRNLAFAALFVLVTEPEAILGASFQLSFAAVAALVSVYETRMAARAREQEDLTRQIVQPLPSPSQGVFRGLALWRRWESIAPLLRQGPGGLLFATFCATMATASFMAYNFHELSPYVLIGNPLTLSIIEIFAVPGALLGTLLYPFGLDAWVWHYIGAGITFIMWLARIIGGWPGATIHLPAFAPWSLVFLSLGVLSAVLWRSALLRASAIPFMLIGLCGAFSGPVFDIAVPPSGDSLALRGRDGRLAVLGPRPSLFGAEQWLRADADGRDARAARKGNVCDKLGCVGHLADGRAVALVLDREAFIEDCRRAAILVTPLIAPSGCAASILIDRSVLRDTGALTLRLGTGEPTLRRARAPDEDRPWSPRPKGDWGQKRWGGDHLERIKPYTTLPKPTAEPSPAETVVESSLDLAADDDQDRLPD